MGVSPSTCCASRKTVKILKAGGEDNIERRKAIAALFDELDLDVNGILSHEELMHLAKALQERPEDWTEQKNNEFYRELDVDNDGDVERPEFVDFFDKKLPDDDHMEAFREKMKEMVDAARAVLAKKPQKEQNEIERRRALAVVFDELDADVSGCLSEKELLAAVCAEQDEDGVVSAEDVNAKLFREMDVGQDGMIDRVEFVTHYNQKLPQDMAQFRAQVAKLRAGVQHQNEKGTDPAEAARLLLS